MVMPSQPICDVNMMSCTDLSCAKAVINCVKSLRSGSNNLIAPAQPAYMRVARGPTEAGGNLYHMCCCRKKNEVPPSHGYHNLAPANFVHHVQCLG